MMERILAVAFAAAITVALVLILAGGYKAFISEHCTCSCSQK